MVKSVSWTSRILTSVLHIPPPNTLLESAENDIRKYIVIKIAGTVNRIHTSWTVDRATTSNYSKQTSNIKYNLVYIFKDQGRDTILFMHQSHLSQPCLAGDSWDTSELECQVLTSASSPQCQVFYSTCQLENSTISHRFVCSRIGTTLTSKRLQAPPL